MNNSKENKIYVVVETHGGLETPTHESGGYVVGVYSSLEKAKKKLAEIVAGWNEYISQPLTLGEGDDGKWSSRVYNEWQAWVDDGESMGMVEIHESTVD